MCGGIFSDNIITNVLLIPTGQYFTKLRHTKQSVLFGPPCICIHAIFICYYDILSLHLSSTEAADKLKPAA